MGTMNFDLPAGLSSDAARDLLRACVVGGPDYMPYPTQVRLESRRLILGRNVEESGALLVPWQVDGAGQLLGSSATLIEREAPYQIQVELARGKVNQVRCQVADWIAGGLQVPPELHQHIHDATRAFSRAMVALPSEQAATHAQQALTLGYRAAEEMVALYAQQVFDVRHQRQPQLEATLGCRLGAVPSSGDMTDAIQHAFNVVWLPLPWSAIEPVESDYRWEPHDALLDWARAHDMPVAAGPIIDFSRAGLPDWLWLWERDLHSLASFMCDYVETIVRRFKGDIRAWQLTAASNNTNLLGLGEDELMWLTVRLVEAARQVDPALELSVGVSQPWGEYMAQEDRTHSPFVFADTLIRSGINVGALDLEFIMGVTPRGSYCHDLLEASRLLDMYALLGVPLRLTMAYPSQTGRPDPQADAELTVSGGHWHAAISPVAQAEWAAAFGSLALCKPTVQGIVWSHLSDADPHQLPHCGLYDAANDPKPALGRLEELRKRHLR
jgi:Glycosyl hydrolase family 10